jgi:transcriptional regulator with XRE-family HTH domain
MRMRKTIYTGEYQALVDWLRAQRAARGLTMRELAGILDVPHSFVGKVETRERRIDLVEFITICSALSVSPHEGLNIALAAADENPARARAVAEAPGAGYGAKIRRNGLRRRAPRINGA